MAHKIISYSEIKKSSYIKILSYLNQGFSYHGKIIFSVIYINGNLHHSNIVGCIIKGASGKRGQVPFENLGDHVESIKQNFGT